MRSLLDVEARPLVIITPFYFRALRKRKAIIEFLHEVSDHPPNQLLIIPSFMKASNLSGYKGARDQGNRGAFSIKNATSPQEHVGATGSPPFPVEDGFRILPDDVKGAVRVASKRQARTGRFLGKAYNLVMGHRGDSPTHAYSRP